MESDSFAQAVRERTGQAITFTGVTEQEVVDADFERRYAQAICAEHGKIRIFGLDISRTHNRGLDLETAYLSLEAVSTSADRSGEYNLDADSINSSARVEKVFKGKRRILLRGQAGSGKSTLMQWIAIKSVSGSLSEDLGVLNNRVPFILRLRAMYRLDNLHPRPNQFLEIGNIPIADDQPSGWADRVLRGGRGLLLVDGMDEIPDEKRDEAKRWLGWVLQHYPNVWALVTVRPSAIPPAWLQDYEFDELALRPMNTVDRAIFIEKWHQAAGLESPPGVARSLFESERTTRELRELQDGLLRALEVTPQLAALTDSPLLCAMICALHRDRHGALPNGRMEIYRAALGMLLARRDQERQVELELEEDEHRALLQEIAAWLVGEGLVEGGKSDAVNQIARMVPSLNRISHKFNATQLYDHVVERSGLITETTTETFEFIHRTFQDYLAAQEFKEARSFKMLASRANEDQWADVIRMTVGHCDYRDREVLLRNILKIADSAEDERARRDMHLLAGSCLPYATRLDASVREDILDRVAQYLGHVGNPARGEVARLAAVGDDLISILPTSDVPPWLIEVLGEIRSERAFDALTSISRGANTAVLDRVAKLWRSFDTRKFADKLLTQVDCSEIAIWVSEVDQLAELKKLGPMRRLVLDGLSEECNSGAFDGVEAAILGVYNSTHLGSLNFAQRMKGVVSLEVFGGWGPEDLSAICNLQLSSMCIVDVARMRVTAGHLNEILSSQDHLQVLGLGSFELELLGTDMVIPSVTVLKLWYPRRGVAGLRKIANAFPNLEDLEIHLDDSGEARVIDLSPFSSKHSFSVLISGHSERPKIRGKHLFSPGSLDLSINCTRTAEWGQNE
ncbi:NACHT domain-containing protein [Streptomyces sp. NPDC046985]|uniref:NACHT domain-containing protein n=1 Tax=Streptomyces sp. NPDC046985 TaxID=3155377 RepID=UPI00340AF2F5